MIDLTKKWKTRMGWPVTGLTATPAGLIVGKVLSPYLRMETYVWRDDGAAFGRGPEQDLVPAEDEPVTPALPDLDARLYLIGCAISGTIASADADINPDPRLTAKWAVEFADEVLAVLAEQRDGAA